MNLQISEMSLQYDYYMKQSNDMENIRKISHDIKNHLEALRGMWIINRSKNT